MTVSWTCPECGLNYDKISPSDAVTALRSFPRRYRAQLTSMDDDEHPDAVIRRRPDAKTHPSITWSALEYTAHVADALEGMDGMFRRMIQKDDPRIADDWQPDERAEKQRYNEMDRDAALDWLQRSADTAAATLADVQPDAWERTGEFDFGRRTLLDMARNAVHEGAHHLRDVEHVLRAVRGRPASVDAGDDE